MRNLDDLIIYENESSSLEFKKVEYQKINHQELIKDIISLANAKIEGNRYIITGVKAFPNGKKEFHGLQSLKDDAIYQQLIHENVEPDLEFEYLPYNLDGRTYGIFEIRNCNNPPYLLKKNYDKLKAGDGFIKKGSHKLPLKRNDLDYYYSKRYSESKFSGEVEITSIINGKKSYGIPVFKKSVQYPSEKAADKINKLIRRMENNEIPDTVHLIHGYSFKNPEAKKSIPELKEELENVRVKYYNQDQYYFYEVDGIELNFEITIDGSDYIEDGYIEVEFGQIDSLKIAKEIYRNPSNARNLAPVWQPLDYPEVLETDNGYVISHYCGDIRHQVPTEIFSCPIRIIIFPDAEPIVKIMIKVHGKNLDNPLKKEIKLKVEIE